jgi:exodeoxyribonuclease I
MAASFYFYDLETSGFNPRTARIMQFAGQRTDMELNPVGEPHDFYIKLSDELVPDPDAIMITGITPQQTNSDGLTEVNFLKLFHEEIAVPGTIFAGFNSVRFDDEFMRYLHYRNFYDAYEWQWQDMRSRWDLLDVIRMTRALRPEGIVWPVDAKGNPTNRLELLAAANNIDHRKAHTALSDVNATIALARLVRDKQPKLFNFLLNLRDKKKVEEFIQGEPAFLYSSGKYSSEIEKTAVVTVLANHPKRQGVLVYDLRCDPSEFANMSAAELADAWKWKKDARTTRLPVKTLQFNRCPAVAPLSVLNKAAQQRLKLNVDTINKHLAQLRILKDWNKRIVEALQLIDQQRQASFLAGDRMVDEQLYDGFFDQPDKDRMAGVRQARPAELAAYEAQFSDQRLRALLPLYKARNFPKHLTDEERAAWEKYRTERLLGGQDKSQLAGYFKRLGELGQRTDLTQDQQYLLEELQLYGQSIMPVVD